MITRQYFYSAKTNVVNGANKDCHQSFSVTSWFASDQIAKIAVEFAKKLLESENVTLISISRIK